MNMKRAVNQQSTKCEVPDSHPSSKIVVTIYGSCIDGGSADSICSISFSGEDEGHGRGYIRLNIQTSFQNPSVVTNPRISEGDDRNIGQESADDYTHHDNYPQTPTPRSEFEVNGEDFRHTGRGSVHTNINSPAASQPPFVRNQPEYRIERQQHQQNSCPTSQNAEFDNLHYPSEVPQLKHRLPSLVQDQQRGNQKSPSLAYQAMHIYSQSSIAQYALPFAKEGTDLTMYVKMPGNDKYGDEHWVLKDGIRVSEDFPAAVRVIPFR